MTVALVTGSHLYGSKEHVFSVLDDLRLTKKITQIITGGADYIDTFAILWAMDRKVNFAVEYPDWEHFGTLAGPMRNQRMLDKHQPACIIAFDGDSGTLDMIQRARARGIEVVQIP